MKSREIRSLEPNFRLDHGIKSVPIAKDIRELKPMRNRLTTNYQHHCHGTKQTQKLQVGYNAL
jgi:hypothetical protein